MHDCDTKGTPFHLAEQLPKWYTRNQWLAYLPKCCHAESWELLREVLIKEHCTLSQQKDTKRTPKGYQSSPGLSRLPKWVRVKNTVSLRPKSDLRATCSQAKEGVLVQFALTKIDQICE
jgi:hypothetical protein